MLVTFPCYSKSGEVVDIVAVTTFCLSVDSQSSGLIFVAVLS
jgi:hypothetical protein